MFQILFEGHLFADYFQIYLRDDANPDLPADCSDAVIARRLAAGRYGVILHTARNMISPVSVEWHDRRPEPDLEAYQHIAEAAFECSSGQLVLAGLTDYEPSAPRLQVKAGQLGVRLNISGLDTLSDDELEGEDRYLIQLWEASDTEGMPVLLVKEWP